MSVFDCMCQLDGANVDGLEVFWPENPSIFLLFRTRAFGSFASPLFAHVEASF